MAVTSSSAAPLLALPSAERPGSEPARNLFSLGVLLASAGGIMGVGALVAAWVSVGHATKPWPPKGVTPNNYSGTMLVLTMLMSAFTVEWGVASVRKNQRWQAVGGFALSIGLGLAFLNLLWFFGRRLGFGPAATPYAVVLFTMLAVAGIGVAIGIVLLLGLTLRVLGQQVGPGIVEMARASAWFWQFLVLTWIVLYATVWLFS
jgi:heme/copper-type cytochrome/quinol oxidase subunit 3